MKAVLFDVDDTLYSEIDFVESGFHAVAVHLARHYSDIREDQAFERMLEVLRSEGRGKVFDKVLRGYGIHSENLTRLLLHVYRTHEPEIALFEDVPAVLKALREQGYRLGAVTDWMATVQRNKVNALALHDRLDVVVFTDDLGREHWKPSPIPFQVALDLLQVKPSEAVYVGDDPGKDFPGPNQLGMLTVQIDSTDGRRKASKRPRNDEERPHHTLSKFSDVLKIVAGVGVRPIEGPETNI